MRTGTARLLLLALSAAAACAHARPAPEPMPLVVWPEAPEAPRVRLAALFPDPSAPPPQRSRLRALLDLVAGVDDDHRRRAAEVLARPFGIAVLPGGAFAVADPDLPAVLRIEPGGAAVRVACRGREWLAPMAAAAGPDGALWIADGGAAEVVRVSPDGTCRAIGAGALERPTGLAVEAERVLVVDPPRHQVVALALDGKELGRYGSLGDGDGQLHFPTAIARAPDGSFLVVDALHFRIARFAADGAWLGAFGSAGDTGGELARPKGIAVDGEGRIYVSDAQRDAVLVFAPDGSFEVALAQGGAEPGRLTMPAGIAVEGRRLYVADSQNHRVQVFELLGDRP